MFLEQSSLSAARSRAFARWIAASALGVVVGAGCTAEPSGLDAGGGPGPAADATSAPLDGSVSEDATVVSTADAEPTFADADGLARSEKARVRWKGEPILRTELATALGLPVADLCKELGTYDCFDVHRVALGGVEPYTLGINEPFPDTSVTAPLAIERIALTGCRTRVDLDLGQPAQAQIFKDLPGTALPDVEALAVRDAVDRLYTRFASRHAEPAEIRALLDLYADVAATPEARPARAWAILSCFAVATSIESLFY